MGTPTRSASRLQPIQKAMATKTTTPKEGKSRAKCHSKSPTSVDVNSILADINLPQTRFANVLTVLGNAVKRNNKTEGNPTPPEGTNPADKEEDGDDLSSSQDSPTTSPGQVMVRINNTSESDPPTNNPTMTTTTRSILCGTPHTEETHQITPETKDFQTNKDPAKRTILNKQSKLLINLGEDRQMKAFHVEDFVGLYPAWLIVEVAISPTGNAKEERMNMFLKGITALFGEILFVDDTVCIPPLEITDNNNDNYISEKAKLPSNFTKLGKWIMISGGSWVSNRKEKGSSNVYARFRL
jgi:hypothetical protein